MSAEPLARGLGTGSLRLVRPATAGFGGSARRVVQQSPTDPRQLELLGLSAAPVTHPYIPATHVSNVGDGHHPFTSGASVVTITRPWFRSF